MIDRAVNAGAGIQVCAKLNPDAFAPRYQAGRCPLAAKMGRPIKSHVLEEMRQAALVWHLQNRAYALRQIEAGQARFSCVVADIVSQSVG